MLSPRGTVIFGRQAKEIEGPVWLGLLRFFQGELDSLGLRRALKELADVSPAGMWRPEGIDDGGLLIGPSMLHPPTEGVRFEILQQEAGELRRCLGYWMEGSTMPVVADFLRNGVLAPMEQLREAWPFEDEPIPEVLLAPAEERVVWPEPDGPGIYRREHASLLICSRKARILLDPICLFRGWPSMELAPFPPPSKVDAIAITHSHGNHWSLPSLLACARSSEVPVLVPKVPRTSLLCPVDFESELSSCEQAFQALPWGSTLKVGDIEVDVLPFYGEQPTCDPPGPSSEIRNWGSCYRFTTEDFSCMVLVDGGVDREGSIIEAVRLSCQRRGPVDVVLACQREFASPFFRGLPYYWATLPYERLQALHQEYKAGRLPSTTGGARGAVAACEAGQARFFLPYANGFEGPGVPIKDIGWGFGEPSEADRVAFMSAQLEARKSATQALTWNSGEAALFTRGHLSWRR